MKRSTLFNLKLYSLIIALLGISGCSRYIDWGKTVFNQGCQTPVPKCITEKYLASLHIYDQLTTVGLFDILWLSDEVRTAYCKLYAQKRGLCKTNYQACLRRQLEENRHFISFYMLAYIPHDSADQEQLGEKCSRWTINLKIGDKCYCPAEIKKIELCPEYKLFFGRTYRHSKTPYIITFNAKTVEGDPLIHANSCMELQFQTVRRKGVVCWQIGPNGNALCYKTTLFDNVLLYDLYDDLVA